VRTRALGRSGINVSAIGLGCWGMSGSYGPADQDEAARTLHHALDCGVTFLDTADSYGDGRNETLIGEVLHDRRSEFALATKTGWIKQKSDDGKVAMGVDCRPERLRQACEASLRRLRTDVIDLYYLHRADPNVPIEDSIGALAELVAAGKIRAIGVSEVSAQTLRRAQATHPVGALQSEYSLWTREAEASVIPACRELGVAFVPFSPLGRGFLSGSLTNRGQLTSTDWRFSNPRFSDESLAANAALLAPLTKIAAARNLTPSQVALAWVLSRGEFLIPIPGTKRRQHLDENLAAVNVALTEDEGARLDAGFPIGAATGARYTPDQARWSGL
jgi:aryl-alcohol dehydrogenase-like predicted oxidoreductase